MTAEGQDLSARSREILAYGGHHRVLLRPLYEDEEGVLPEFAQSAEGYEIVDERGRVFIDWGSAWGPVLLGYGHPAVQEAIEAQLRAGPLLTLPHRVELDVASLLIDMVPCAEMVAFGKNGSDVATAAVRIARAATGRLVVLQHGFHGFHDWYVCQYPSVKGVPLVLRSQVRSFPYNDLPALELLFDEFREEVAAVVMEPVCDRAPEDGYLEAVLELAHDNGALLVFDELVTGFRLALGGAQELYGVTPDLACVGKAMANGMPLSAVVGKREYMERLPETSYGMTFRGETLSLAAARAVLTTLREAPVVEHVARIGSLLRTRFAETCEKHGVGCDLMGPPARMAFSFHEAGGISPERLRSLFIRECARNGVLTTGMLYPTYAHDERALEQTLTVFDASLAAVAEVIAQGREVVGQAVRAGFAAAGSQNGAERGAALPDGHIDALFEDGDRLVVIGWMLLEEGPPQEIAVSDPEGVTETAARVPRPDLAKAFPGVGGAGDAGFSVSLPAQRFAPAGEYDFTIEARDRGDTVFRRRIVRGRRGRPAPPAPPNVGPDGVLRL
jgi:glutamate-1-semialdehyde 2,1-aminomutase